VCDNVISTVRFSLFKLVKFSFLFFSYLLLVFITPVNKDYHFLRATCDHYKLTDAPEQFYHLLRQRVDNDALPSHMHTVYTV